MEESEIFSQGLHRISPNGYRVSDRHLTVNPEYRFDVLRTNDERRRDGPEGHVKDVAIRFLAALHNVRQIRWLAPHKVKQ